MMSTDDFEIAYNLVSHKDSLDSESYLLRKQNKYIKKRFYDTETNSAAFCIIQQMPIKPSSPSIQLK